MYIQPYIHQQHGETALGTQPETQLNQLFLPKHLPTENVPRCISTPHLYTCNRLYVYLHQLTLQCPKLFLQTLPRCGRCLMLSQVTQEVAC